MEAVAATSSPRAGIDVETMSRAEIAAAMRGAFLILDSWGVDARSGRRILGQAPERTFYAWKAGDVGRVPADTLRRIGYLAGIYKALTILYADPATAAGWVNRPNAAFGGRPPLERMAAGDVTDLAAVRAYLDAARGPWS